MKIQNIEHPLIGRYAVLNGTQYLVTGAMSKHKSGRGTFFRLWNPITKAEIWTKGNDTFQRVVQQKDGAHEHERDMSERRQGYQDKVAANR